MEKIKQLTVFYDHRKVGRLAIYKKYLTAFEYDREWLENGFSISPFSLPLQKGVFVSKADPFEGLFGIFADSLPDGFGRLLVDRLLLSYHLDPMRVGSLNRLAIVGESGMGALTYKPDIHFESPHQDLDLDEISKRCREILETSSCENLDHLFHLGGSSGGARPKILTKVDGEDWIIKFPSSGDREISAGRNMTIRCAPKNAEYKCPRPDFSHLRFVRATLAQSGLTDSKMRVKMKNEST